MCITTEIVTMKTVEGITKEAFLQIVSDLEENFHSKQPGYIDSELLNNEKKEEWIMIQHWDDLHNLKESSKKMFHNPTTQTFVASLHSKSVKMTILPQLGTWNK